MKKTLLVCSPSTRKYFMNIDEYRIITDPLSATEAEDLKDSEESVIAVGGGAVIDAAKIICRNPVICYPTTASGTSFTSHSVCWDEHKKISINVPLPKAVIVREEFLQTLPNSVIRKTKYDAVSHCLDSMWSSKSTDRSTDMAEEALNMLLNYENLSTLITAGNLAGRVISIVPTTILHSLSYPLTGIYGISHGEALGFLLESVCEVMDSEVAKELNIPKLDVGMFSVSDVSEEALTYSKLQDTSKNFDLQDVKQIYMDAIRRNTLKR